VPEIIVKLGDNVVHRYVFDKDVISIGRARDNDVVIENLSVSRNHARVRKEGGRFILTDLNSANGTFVNGVRITRVEVVDEDIISIGKHKLFFYDKKPKEEEVIGEAFGAERTMLVDQVQTAFLKVSKGKQAGQVFPIVKYESYLGRASDNDIRLHDWFVSKKHAVIIRQGSNFFIKDLGSWRGTMVNNKSVRDSELKEGDEIQLGTMVLTFTLEGEAIPAQITGRVPQELAYDEEPAPEDLAEAGEMPEAPPQGAEEEREEAPAEAFPVGAPATAAIEPSAGGAVAPAAPSAAGGEFEPFSEEELEALEKEEEELGLEEVAVPAPLQQAEAMNAPLGGAELSSEEMAFAQRHATDEEESSSAAPPEQEMAPLQKEEQEEEAALLGVASEPVAATAVPETAPSQESIEPDIGANLPEYASTLPAAAPDTGVLAFDDLQKEISMWEQALRNKSKVIRRQAAKKLMKLTGRYYDWESEPR